MGLYLSERDDVFLGTVFLLQFIQRCTFTVLRWKSREFVMYTYIWMCVCFKLKAFTLFPF